MESRARGRATHLYFGDAADGAVCVPFVCVIVVFEDGQGLFTFLLFGLQPEVFAAAHRLYYKLRSRLGSSSWAKRLCCYSEAGGDAELDVSAPLLGYDSGKM